MLTKNKFHVERFSNKKTRWIANYFNFEKKINIDLTLTGLPKRKS